MATDYDHVRMQAANARAIEEMKATPFGVLNPRAIENRQKDVALSHAQTLATVGLVFALTVFVGALVCGIACWLVEGML